MNKVLQRYGAIALSSAFCLASAARMNAQAATPEKTAPETEEEIIELSAFTVSASDSSTGYQSKDTLAGTRVRTDLSDVASALTVVNKQFLDDTGAKNSAGLLVYTTNTEVGGLYGNYSGNSGGSTYNEGLTLGRPNSNTRVRGLTAADNTRDYFLTDIPWDAFNVDRVDLQRGPNSILFGVGSPSGIINTSVNRASFKNKNIVENVMGQYGSTRFSGDFNYVLKPGALAVRVSLLDNNEKYQQKPAFSHDQRYYASVRFAPKLFGEGSHSNFHVNFEQGKIKANRPRSLPPLDLITPWFYTGKDAYGNANLNKLTYDQTKVSLFDPPYSDTSNTGTYPVAWLANSSLGQIDNQGVIVGIYGDNFVSDPTNGIKQYTLIENAGLDKDGVVGSFASTGNIAGLNLGAHRPGGISSYSKYMTASGAPGGSYYSDRSLSDPSVFDFYNNLLDGDNKRENEKWKALNVGYSQTFKSDRYGFELVYDLQRYDSGRYSVLDDYRTYAISVDMISRFKDGSENPNVGRAYVSGKLSYNESSYRSDRDNFRLTSFADIRASDYIENSKLAKILGHHIFTGLLSHEEQNQYNRVWSSAATTVDYANFFAADPTLLSTSGARTYQFLNYISPSLAGLGSAAGANIDRMRNVITAPKTASVSVFDTTWAKPLDPDATGYVDPNAPYTFSPLAASLTGAADVVSTQSENPANYVGWRNMNVPYLRAADGEIDKLTVQASHQRTILSSASLTYQGYLFDGLVVPAFGWRQDRVEDNIVSGNKAPNDPNGINGVSAKLSLNPNGRTITKGESKSWGLMVHMPKKWSDRLPGSTNVSAFFNRSENFAAVAARADAFGHQLENPRGSTKDYGVVVSTLDERVQVKATWYETKVANQTLTGVAPSNFMLWAVPAWGLQWVPGADKFLKGGLDDYAWAYDYARQDNPNSPERKLPDGSINPAWLNDPGTQKLRAAVDAWKNIPIGQDFWNVESNGDLAVINADAIRQGKWDEVYADWNTNPQKQLGSSNILKGYSSEPTTTVDSVSKGVEIELYGQITKNWKVTVNASKTTAIRESLAPTTEKLFTEMNAFFAGNAGDIKLWGCCSAKDMWKGSVANPFAAFKQQQGAPVPELAPWRYNVISSYSFSEGALKGAFLGGAFRWEDRRVLGYQYKASIDTIDIAKPYRGPSDDHLDVWVGYSRDVAKNVNWKIQLNLQNFGESSHLVPLAINPDGKVAYSRIQEGMIWRLTNTFTF